MDWTGGVRRRFAAAKTDAVLQRQKAHFAKARATSQTKQRSLRSSKGILPPTMDHSFRNSESRNYSRGRARSRRTPVEKTLVEARDSNERHSIKQHSAAKLASAQRPARDRSLQSIIYNRSSELSSSPRSLSVAGIDVRGPGEFSPGMSQQHNMTTEERLLLANRQRLLARNDWLGLSYVRPVQISFPSSHGKDRIGKRRKVGSSASRKPKPAEKISNAPLFRMPVLPQEPLMSGALHNDNIRIKIGTDALASQTQVSRHSQRSGKTSLRPAQSELSHLSEESMLLGADGDTFESALLQDGVEHVFEGLDSDIKRTPLLGGGPMIPQAQCVPEQAQMRSFSEIHDTGRPFGVLKSPHTYENAVKTTSRLPGTKSPSEQQELTSHTYDEPETHDGLIDLVQPEHERPSDGVNNATVTSVANDLFSEQEEDEEMWKRLMGIDHASRDASVAALKSSSMHLTNSDTSIPRPIFEKSSKSQHSPTRILASQRDDELDATRLGIPYKASSEGNSKTSSSNLQSPSASFKLMAKCAESTSVPARTVQEDTDNDALWREFVIRSQQSSDSVSGMFDRNTLRDETGSTTAAPASSAFALSGLGTSIKSTLGEQDLASTMHPSTQTHIRSSLDEVDSIEDVDSPTRAASHGKNFHAAPTSILNPRRFRRPRNEPKNKKKMASRFHNARKVEKVSRRDRSVYDLVDSDGLSLGN